MKILVVGGGGREHALVWALSRELPAGGEIFAAPGNPGTAALASNIAVAANDVAGLVGVVDELGVDLTVVGPEAPLAAGLVDRLESRGRRVFGPRQDAARLEASKAYAKQVMDRAGVPTAASETFTELQPALDYIAAHAEPLVVKASGLAAGKGAIVCQTRPEASAAVESMLAEDRFGEAGRTVVVESFLEGEECSVLAITDGKHLELLPVSQDHKRLEEGDTGPNTGGMGAYSPVSIVTPSLLERVRERILAPTLAQLAAEGVGYRGVLYAGLMVDGDGNPSVVEFNCRLGDPEAQVVLPLTTGGLLECFQRVARGESPSPIDVLGTSASVTTVLAARGYPQAPEKGAEISLPDDLPDGVTLFHAGTALDPSGRLVASGGRVMNVTAVAPTFTAACDRSRRGAEAVTFEGKVYRRDIGWRERERARPVSGSGT